MDIKMLLTRSLIFLFFQWIQIYASQQKTDTLKELTTRYPNYYGLVTSNDNRWILAHKKYSHNADTLLILDAKAPKLLKGYLMKFNVKQRFIGNTAIVAQGSDSARYIRLKDFKSIDYIGVKKMDVMAAKKRFILLDKNNSLKIFDENANLLREIKNVKDYISDEQKVLIAIVKNGQVNNLVNLMANSDLPLYSTNNEIVGTPLFHIDEFASFTETDYSKGIRNILVDLHQNKVQIPLGDTFFKGEFLRVTSLGKDKGFLIDFEQKIEREINKVVDILYGNDRYLRSKKKGLCRNEFWIWNSKTEIAHKLPSEHFSDYVSMNSLRYVLAFNNAEQFNYRYSSQIFPLFIFDRDTNKSLKICEATRDVVISSNSRYITMLNQIDKRWELFDVSLYKKFILGGEMQRPSYSADNKYILFESNKGLLIYALQQHKFLEPVLRDKRVSILRKNHQTVYEKYSASFTISCENLSYGLTLKAVNTEQNSTEYFRFDGQKMYPLIESTDNNIKEIVFSTNKKSTVKAFTIEEFYDKIPQFFLHDYKSKKAMALKTPTNNEVGLKREVLNYKNSLGRLLKGVLFYPVNFDNTKRYPMVVRLYQEQNSISNKYLYPIYEGDGFNIRILMERGYFVFLPDTVVDERGSGISALDCVNSALDAVSELNYIDMQKVGLIGHSFGGYETNYIATQSDRFATYVSGAGMSNILSRYFSYNPNYGINEYSRIETGQFDMNEPFSQAKNKYLENDPIYDAERVNVPILLWSGIDDVNVPVSQTTTFYTALQRNNKNVVVLLYANQDHVLTNGSEAIFDLNRRILEWWDYFLKGKENVKWISKQIKMEAG